MDSTFDAATATAQLARVLYEALEKADPSDDVVEWAELQERDRNVFISAVRAIIADRQLLEAAAGG